MMNHRHASPGLTALILALVMSGCVIRAGTTETAPDVEQFASAGEALDKVTTAGLREDGELRRARSFYEDLKADVDAQVAAGQDDPLLLHVQTYLDRTLAYYDEVMPLYGTFEGAAVENQPGISSQIYEAQKAYLQDLVALDRDMDLPSVTAMPMAAIPTEATLEEGLLADEIELDEAEIASLYEAGEYGELVAMVAEGGSQKESLSPYTRSLYAFSLAEQGLYTDAINQAEALSQGDLIAPGVLDLRLDAAIWMIAAGQTGAAETSLRRMMSDAQDAGITLTHGQEVGRAMLEELDRGTRSADLVAARKAMEQERFVISRELLQGVLAGQSSTETRNRAEVLLNQLAAAEDKVFERRLIAARNLGSTPGQQSAAREILQQLEVDFPGDRFKARIEAVQKEIDGTATHDEVSYVERLEAANALMAAKKYEQAAKEFQALAGSPVAGEAKAGRERAVDLHVQQVREQMARDYLAAKRLSNPTQRLEAMAKVYDELKEVSETYPESRMTPKLGSHIQVVKTEILKIDPGYFD